MSREPEDYLGGNEVRVSNQAILVSGRLQEKLGEADKFLIVVRKISLGLLRCSKAILTED